MKDDLHTGAGFRAHGRIGQVAFYEFHSLEPGKILAFAGDEAVNASYRLAACQKLCRN